MNIPRLLASVVAATVLVACGESGPELSASNIQIVAPAPGRSASVAYLSITNVGDATRLTAISSPEFATVELHETTIENGIARMQRVSALDIGANSTVNLEPGGLHIMLLDPSSALLPGKRVSLRLEFESGEFLIVDAPLATRVNVD